MTCWLRRRIASTTFWSGWTFRIADQASPSCAIAIRLVQPDSKGMNEVPDSYPLLTDWGTWHTLHIKSD